MLFFGCSSSIVNMSTPIEDAEKLKTEGTEQFRLGNFEAVSEKYEAAAEMFRMADSTGSCTVARVASLNNAAMCHLKLESWVKAKCACNQV
jgi:Lon protease-like protein